MQYYILTSDDGEQTYERAKKHKKKSPVYVLACVIIELSLPFFCFYEDYIFFECGLNNMFTAGSVLLLIGSYCECVFVLYTFTVLVYTHRYNRRPTESDLT